MHTREVLDAIAHDVLRLQRRTVEAARVAGVQVDPATTRRLVDEVAYNLRRLGVALSLEGADTIARGLLECREAEPKPANAPTASAGG